MIATLTCYIYAHRKTDGENYSLKAKANVFSFIYVTTCCSSEICFKFSGFSLSLFFYHSRVCTEKDSYWLREHSSEDEDDHRFIFGFSDLHDLAHSCKKRKLISESKIFTTWEFSVGVTVGREISWKLGGKVLVKIFSWGMGNKSI